MFATISPLSGGVLAEAGSSRRRNRHLTRNLGEDPSFGPVKLSRTAKGHDDVDVNPTRSDVGEIDVDHEGLTRREVVRQAGYRLGIVGGGHNPQVIGRPAVGVEAFAARWPCGVLDPDGQDTSFIGAGRPRQVFPVARAPRNRRHEGSRHAVRGPMPLGTSRFIVELDGPEVLNDIVKVG